MVFRISVVQKQFKHLLLCFSAFPSKDRWVFIVRPILVFVQSGKACSRRSSSWTFGASFRAGRDSPAMQQLENGWGLDPCLDLGTAFHVWISHLNQPISSDEWRWMQRQMQTSFSPPEVWFRMQHRLEVSCDKAVTMLTRKKCFKTDRKSSRNGLLICVWQSSNWVISHHSAGSRQPLCVFFGQVILRKQGRRAERRRSLPL